MLISDGPDHRLTYLSVKVALIALFRSLDLDMLIAIWMCPYQSWTNMAERVMSTLNLALQNVSLARAAMDPELELMIHSKTTLTDLWDTISRSSALASAFRDSMSSVIVRLAQRFNQMKLKEDPVQCATAASDKDVDEFFKLLHFIEPSLSPDNLTKSILKTSPALQNFLETHCHSSHYVFQIHKCLDRTCYNTTHLKWIQQSFKTYNFSHCHYLMTQRSTTIHLQSSMVVSQVRRIFPPCNNQVTQMQ